MTDNGKEREEKIMADIADLTEKGFAAIQDTLSNHSDSIEQLRQECDKRWQITDHNYSEIVNAINHILNRLRLVEDKKELTH